MSTSNKPNKKGYLLLEVVVSVAIVAIGLGVILRSYASSLRASKIAQEYFEASLLVKEKLCVLEEQERMEGKVTAAETTETFSGTPYTLTTKIVNMPDPDPLNEITTVIYWKNKERSEKIEIGTYLKNK